MDDMDEMVTIPLTEYNGLKNALRILHDRSAQQVDKAVTDAHGYTFLRADYRIYDARKSTTERAWLITKATPYAVKIPLDEIEMLVKRDLSAYYGYAEPLVIAGKRMYASDYLQAHKQLTDPCHTAPWICDNSTVGIEIKKYFDAVGYAVPFEVVGYAYDFARGVYTVRYWATGLT